MDNDEFLKDRFLKELISKSRTESPSDEFVEKVMAGIRLNPEPVPAAKPYYLFLRSAWPYAAIALTVIVILASSDLPYSKFIPGKEYFENNFIPYFKTLSGSFVSLFGFLRSATLPFVIIASGTLLFIFDRVFLSRHSIRNYFTS
jgi:hypothetical protein